MGLLLMGFRENAPAQSDGDLILKMVAGRDSLVDEVLRNAGRYHLQIMLSLERPDSLGGGFTHSQLNRDRYYFYPASLIKFPLAVVAAEQMSRLSRTQGLTLDDGMAFSLCSCDKGTSGYLGKTRPASFRQVLREMMVMSNNDAYNLMFDMVGIDSVNTRMRELGYGRILMNRRFVSPCESSLQRRFGGIRFHSTDGALKHLIPCTDSKGIWEFGSDWPHEAGYRHMVDGKWVAGPNSYRGGNHVSLHEAHDLMIRLVRPDAFGSDTLRLDSTTRAELIQSMGMFPRELESVFYPKGKYPDHYYKFFLDPKTMQTADGTLRIYNKVGLASGFLSDVSYFHDDTNGVRFFLSACILASRKGDAGSGKYDYYDLGIPFLRRLGTLIYRHLADGRSLSAESRDQTGQGSPGTSKG